MVVHVESVGAGDTVVVSVIMINRNGGAYLAPAVASCRAALTNALSLEPGIELVIVDNDSTDNPGPTIARELAGAPFRWRVVTEPRAGVNSARNAGIAAAKGDLLFFVDSDLDFDPGWMRAHITAARRHPGASVIGGRLRVGKVEAPPPPWLAMSGPFVRRSIVVTCEYGEETAELPIDEAHGPVGPNMGFRREVFSRFGLFDTRFGLRPGSLVPGAESEFFDRLSRGGVRFLYVADAVVDHPLRKSQMTRRYFQERLRGVGRATSRLRRLRGDPARRFCGMTLYMVRRLAGNVSRYLAAILALAPAAERFHARGEVAVALGFLQEDFAAWRDRRAGAPDPDEVSSPRTFSLGKR